MHVHYTVAVKPSGCYISYLYKVMLISILFALLVFSCAGESIRKEDMDMFLVKVSLEVGDSQTVENPIERLQVLAAAEGIDSKSMFQLVGVACEISQGNEHHQPVTFNNVEAIKNACEFLDGIGAQYLAFMGRRLSKKREENLSELMRADCKLQNSRVYYPQVKDTLPRVCEKIRAGKTMRRIGRKLDSAHVLQACNFLETIAMDFLTGFDRYSPSENMVLLLGDHTPITTSDGQRVTYNHVKMMLPSVCEKMRTNFLHQNQMPNACIVFGQLTYKILASVGQYINNSGPVIEHLDANSLEFHEAKPFIPHLCRHGGMNWYMEYVLNIDAPWSIMACNYFLHDHMEALVR